MPHYYTMLTLRAFLWANISRTWRLSISENLYRSILRIPKSDSSSWDIRRSCSQICLQQLELWKLRSLLATVTGRVKNIMYAVTTSGKQTANFPDSWWYSVSYVLRILGLLDETAGTGSGHQQLSIQIRWNVVAVLLCQFCHLILQLAKQWIRN